MKLSQLDRLLRSAEDSPTLQSVKGRVRLVGEDPAPSFLALAVVCAPYEPEVEGALFEPMDAPLGELGPWGIVGRGRDEPSLPLVRLRPRIYRPGEDRLMGDIHRDAYISRRQFLLRRTADGGLEVQNLADRRLLHEGVPVHQTTVRPGELLEVERHLLLLCVERPRSFPRWPEGRLNLGEYPFGQPDPFELVGESPALWEVRRTVEYVAGTEEHVLILGLSGVGKDLVAQALHRRSSRRTRELLKMNAAAIRPELAASELFGHVRGAFTGAVQTKPGVIELADGSTLYLDEIGELPPEVQAGLLTVMDERGEFCRIGDPTIRHSDFRLIGTTNRLEEELRKDFVARFGERVRVPGLNDRREDIPFLVRHLLQCQAAEPGGRETYHRFFTAGDGRCVARVTTSLMEALIRHSYETNVRELDYLLTQCARESYPGDFLSPAPALAAELEATRGNRRVTVFDLHGGNSGAPGGGLSTCSAPSDDPAAGAVSSGLPSRELHIFGEHVHLLNGQRKYRFQMEACTAATDYPANCRESARNDLHLLMSLALVASGWNRTQAIELLMGVPDQGGRASFRLGLKRDLSQRLTMFVNNLLSSTPAQPAAPEQANNPDAIEDRQAIRLKKRYSDWRWQHIRLVRFAIWTGALELPEGTDGPPGSRRSRRVPGASRGRRRLGGPLGSSPRMAGQRLRNQTAVHDPGDNIPAKEPGVTMD